MRFCNEIPNQQRDADGDRRRDVNVAAIGKPARTKATGVRRELHDRIGERRRNDGDRGTESEAKGGTIQALNTSNRLKFSPLPELSRGKEKALYSFRGAEDGFDGCRPWAPLIDVNGTLYGTTANHLLHGDAVSTAFALTP